MEVVKLPISIEELQEKRNEIFTRIKPQKLVEFLENNAQLAFNIQELVKEFGMSQPWTSITLAVLAEMGHIKRTPINNLVYYHGKNSRQR